MATANKYEDGVFGQAKDRLKHYTHEVEQEPWKVEHDNAMKCLSFEATLACGINLFDMFINMDEVLRDAALRGDTELTGKKVADMSRQLFEWWLQPCQQVEAALREFEKCGYEVTGAANFRKRFAEAEWMLKPAAKAFDHSKMVEARDNAIDELRDNKASA